MICSFEQGGSAFPESDCGRVFGLAVSRVSGSDFLLLSC